MCGLRLTVSLVDFGSSDATAIWKNSLETKKKYERSITLFFEPSSLY